MALHAAVLAGGGATRLWPLSGSKRPKWLLRPLQSPEGAPVRDVTRDPVPQKKISGREQPRKHLLAQAIERAQACTEHVVVITAEDQMQMVTQALGDLHLPVLGEPQPRDTAGAIAFACAWALSREDDPELLMLPGDAVLEKPDRFAACVTTAREAAQREHALVTFGIQPRYPATGFGYIQAGDAVEGLEGCRHVTRFVEKPSREKAMAYLADGNHFWNSGIFLFRVVDMVAEFERQLPAHAQAVRELTEILRDGGTAVETGSDAGRMQDIFTSMTRVSIDYGIMEKAAAVAVVPVALAWDDVGSYSALAARLPEDGNSNRSNLPLYTLDAEGCTVLAGDDTRKNVVALVGVQDLTVVETDGVLVILPSSRDQDIKQIVEALRKEPGAAGWLE